MRKNLPVLFTLLSGISFGQTFNAANEMIIGDNHMMYQCDSAALSLSGTIGTGVTWDYSNIAAMTNPNKNYSIDANMNTADYPNSNKVINIQNVLTTYLHTTATTRDVLAFEYKSASALGDIKMIFNTDSLNLMDYDFAFNSSLNDIFTGELKSAFGNTTCSGSSTSIYDGIGTLILSPTVTKTNVSRHHFTATIDANFPVGPISIPVQLIIDEFDYYDLANKRIPVFSYVNIVIKQSGAKLSDLNFVLNTELPTSTAGLNQLNNLEVSIYPNPATEVLHLEGADALQADAFEVFDQQGKLVLTPQVAETISLNGLPNGKYTLIVRKGENKGTYSFIRQ